MIWGNPAQPWSVKDCFFADWMRLSGKIRAMERTAHSGASAQ
jgi:hypothetical protein